MRTTAIISALVAVIAWRRVSPLKNTLIKSNFPAGYFAFGAFDEQCHVVKAEGLKFCEDETFWELKDASTGTVQDRKVIVSCDEGRHSWNTVMGPLRDPNPRGALFIYSPKDGSSAPQRISLDGYPDGHDFHPLGIEIYPSFSGNASNLFVVNHARARTVIEQFLISPSKPTNAKWIRTISSRTFVSPNSLALTSPTSFYVTNDHLLTRRLSGLFGKTLPLLETFLGLPLGWVAHVDVGDSADAEIEHTFAKFGIPFANGIAISPDGAHVAVASSSMNTVSIYTRNSSTNALTFAHSIELPYCADNVSYDEEGTLIVAGHPNFLDLMLLAAQKKSTAPSWVVSIDRREVTAEVIPSNIQNEDSEAIVPVSTKVQPSKSHRVRTLFQSDGTGFSSSTTGLLDPLTGKFFVTGLYESGLLVCDKK